jgi:peptide deformylase
MPLKICQVGEAVLRETGRRLTREEILSEPVQQLIREMRDTMYAAPGVGLAAPQIGLPLQIAVIEDKPEYIAKMKPEEAAQRERNPVAFHVIINPVLMLVEGDPAEFLEGCLSVAGFAAVVPRARRVHVDCLNERAEPVSIDAVGWYARILQHEIDHLNGTLYIDRMYTRTFAKLIPPDGSS